MLSWIPKIIWLDLRDWIGLAHPTLHPLATAAGEQNSLEYRSELTQLCDSWFVRHFLTFVKCNLRLYVFASLRDSCSLHRHEWMNILCRQTYTHLSSFPHSRSLLPPLCPALWCPSSPQGRPSWYRRLRPLWCYKRLRLPGWGCWLWAEPLPACLAVCALSRAHLKGRGGDERSRKSFVFNFLSLFHLDPWCLLPTYTCQYRGIHTLKLERHQK